MFAGLFIFHANRRTHVPACVVNKCATRVRVISIKLIMSDSLHREPLFISADDAYPKIKNRFCMWTRMGDGKCTAVLRPGTANRFVDVCVYMAQADDTCQKHVSHAHDCLCTTAVLPELGW